LLCMMDRLGRAYSTNAWTFLAIAIVLEVTGMFFLKLSDTFDKWQWGMLSMACYGACFWMSAPR